MKKILFIILPLFIACKSEQEIKSAATKEISDSSIYKNPDYKKLKEFQGDTLKYLQTNFLEHRDFYTGKPLDILLNDLEIEVKSYSNGVSAKNINSSPDLSLDFYSRNQKKAKMKEKKDPLVLFVIWEVPLEQEKNVELLRKNKGQWTAEEKKYYGQYNIKDIGMVVPNY